MPVTVVRCAIWSKQRARLGPKKAVELLKAGANLRLEKKLLEMDMISEMRSWLVEPEDSDDEDAIANTEPLGNPDEENPMKLLGTRMDDKAEQERVIELNKNTPEPDGECDYFKDDDELQELLEDMDMDMDMEMIRSPRADRGW